MNQPGLEAQQDLSEIQENKKEGQADVNYNKLLEFIDSECITISMQIRLYICIFMELCLNNSSLYRLEGKCQTRCIGKTI